MKYPIDKITTPIANFIQQEKSGGIVLGISVIIALVLANSPWAEAYHHFFEHKIGFQFDGETYLNYSLHHWINDGLMSIFFFVVGLELKREFIAGELKSPKKALLPIGAAIGGIIVPATIYLALNPSGEASQGWGIPMATDIAFALGVLFLLGDRVPFPLKVFLTALAIVDDLGAVLVIAFFYTSEISTTHLLIAFGFLGVIYIGNRMGIRKAAFYALVGILGVWLPFLLSGVHATIAAVLVAFFIPTNVRLREQPFINKVQNHLQEFKSLDPNNKIPTLTAEQLQTLNVMKKDVDKAVPLLQKLEHSMHPWVTYFIIPLFALANAGVSLNLDLDALFSTNIVFGVGFGLLLGKVVGIFGVTWLLAKLKIAEYPTGMTNRNLLGLGFLASIGFTMSLFVMQLAFDNEVFITQSKIGIFAASIIGGVSGYMILNKKRKNKK